VTQLALIGASGYSSCPAGTYSTAGNATCTPCLAGRYSASAAGVSDCSVFGIDTFSLIAATVSTPCPINKVSPSGSSACQRLRTGQPSISAIWAGV